MVQPALTPGTQGGTPYLLANLEKIGLQWSDSGQNWIMSFAITDDHEEQFTLEEKYAPVDNRITIYDVRELLRPYFNLSDHPGLTGFDSLGLKSLTDTRRVQFSITLFGSMRQFCGTYHVAYSNAPSDYLHAGTGNNGIGSRFLTRGNLKKISAAQPCSVSFFGHGETLKVKILHYVNGVPFLTKLPDVTSEDSGNMQTYNFTLEGLAEVAEMNVDDIIYVDLQLFLNSTPQDSVRFMHEPLQRPNERLFAFIGAMGEPEFMVFKGAEKREAEFEGVFLMEHNHYRKADTDLRCMHTCFTGPLSEEERELVWDMAVSPWVYVIENGRLREVTITEVELNDSLPHREPIGYNIKFRYTAELEQRTFNRKQNVPHTGVFDKTFDNTFD